MRTFVLRRRKELVSPLLKEERGEKEKKKRHRDVFFATFLPLSRLPSSLSEEMEEMDRSNGTERGHRSIYNKRERNERQRVSVSRRNRNGTRSS